MDSDLSEVLGMLREISSRIGRIETRMDRMEKKIGIPSTLSAFSENNKSHVSDRGSDRGSADTNVPESFPESTRINTPQRQVRKSNSRQGGPHFYAIHGQSELCEIDGARREMRVIGKIDNALSSLARKPGPVGDLYAVDGSSLLQIDPSRAKVRRVATIKMNGIPVRRARGLCFSPLTSQCFCLVLKGSIRDSSVRGDMVCSLNYETGKLLPAVVIELNDVVGLCCSRRNASVWYAWSSYRGLLRVTKEILTPLGNPPLGVSIRSLAMDLTSGMLYGIGDRMYRIRMYNEEESGDEDDNLDDREIANVEPMTGPLPVSCDGLVYRADNEGFFSPSMVSPPSMKTMTSPSSKIMPSTGSKLTPRITPHARSPRTSPTKPSEGRRRKPVAFVV